jgi:hypothetical protein
MQQNRSNSPDPQRIPAPLEKLPAEILGMVILAC